jgi:hypothetical protein
MEYALMSLKKLALMVPLAIALGLTGDALAQTSPPKTDDKAPVAGANSFTEGQAKSRIEGAGFTQVTGLKKDDNGVWRGSAMQNGKQVTVSVDFRGNVVTP